jgi:endonuclease/exonuclease/phosphatase family metal-dependent hydrolase
MPWCIGGDFNVTLFHSERLGGARMRRAMTAFVEFTANQGLMDLPLSGGMSTWSNNLSWSRLDRFLVSPEWDLCYSGLMQKKLLHVFFDHAPILLARGGLQNGKHSLKKRDL